MSLPRMSAKRLAAIKDGSWKPKPRKAMKRSSDIALFNNIISGMGKQPKEVRAGSPEASKVLQRAFGKGKGSERSKAMKLADKHFSEFIRLRDSDEEGRVTCITCSHTDYWRYLQNGHCLERGNMSTRYDERNCNTQCSGCNWNGGQRIKHEAAIEAKYGAGTVAALELKEKVWRATKSQIKTQDFLFYADTYKKRVYNIRINSPGKFK